MSPSARWFAYVANLVVGGTGLLLGWMLFLPPPDDPFALAAHPWQPGAKSWHVVSAPFLVASIGWFWAQHAWSYWRGGTRIGRRSGVALLLSAGPMVLSGYLLQVAVDPLLRSIWLWTHVLVSLLWMGAIGIHILIHRRRAKS